MKTYEARLLVEVDGDSVGDMLENLQQFTNAVASTDRVRVSGYQWDRPKDEVRLDLDIRRPGWKNYVKTGGKP